MATGNMIQLRGPGTQGASGNAGFFRVDTDGSHVVANNAMQNWANLFPTVVQGVYGPNAGSIDTFTLLTYAQVTAAWTPGNASGKSFLIRNAASVSFAGIAAGGGSAVVRITSDEANFRSY